jgi:hypothetical protein
MATARRRKFALVCRSSNWAYCQFLSPAVSISDLQPAVGSILGRSGRCDRMLRRLLDESVRGGGGGIIEAEPLVDSIRMDPRNGIYLVEMLMRTDARPDLTSGRPFRSSSI